IWRSSHKLIFLAALFVFALGLQVEVEARNINTPCNTVKDCANPIKCECHMNLCFCHLAMPDFITNTIDTDIK
ncbi:hypothetical protein QQP08_026531, partial [Theobroma cacao]